MKFIKKIKKLERSQKVSLILLLSVFIASFSFAIVYSIASYLVIKTIGSVQIPSGHYLNDLDPANPQFEISFKLTNKLFTDITDFSIFISEDLVYHEMDNNTEKRVNIFNKQIFFGKIAIGKKYSKIFFGNYSDFDISNLIDFSNNANMSKEIKMFLDIHISGKTLWNLVPFDVKITDLCPTCLV